jgi:hypothetical protein
MRYNVSYWESVVKQTDRQTNKQTRAPTALCTATSDYNGVRLVHSGWEQRSSCCVSQRQLSCTTPTPHGTSLNCDIRNNKVLTFCSDKDLQLPGYYPATLWMALKHAMKFLHTITCITTVSQPQCYANRTFHGVVLKHSQISLLITTNWFLFRHQLRSGGQKSKYL